MAKSVEKTPFIPVREFYGVRWSINTTQESIDAVRNYDIRPDDVFVVTYPKAGTHWVTEMLSLIYANGKVDDVDRDQTGGALEFGDFHAGTAIQAREERPAPTYVQAQTWKSPRVITSHVLEEFLPQQLKEGKGKVIYVIRNPKDTAVSYWHFIKDRVGAYSGLNLEWGAYIKQFLKGETPYGPWYSHVKPYWEKHRDSRNFLFLYYEDIKKNHRGTVVQLADFIGRPLSEEVIDNVVKHSSIQAMRETHFTSKAPRPGVGDESLSTDSQHKRIGAYGLLRKGVVGDWKSRFTVNQNEMFDDIYNRELEGTGINIVYEKC